MWKDELESFRGSAAEHLSGGAHWARREAWCWRRILAEGGLLLALLLTSSWLVRG
jgi:hypothetical protein